MNEHAPLRQPVPRRPRQPLDYSAPVGYGQSSAGAHYAHASAHPGVASDRPERHAGGVDSTYAWVRLAACVLISTLGGVGMWSVVVTLPAVQAEFGVARADASLPYTATMIGCALGGIVMGRAVDRLGILLPLLVGILALGGGYIASAYAQSLWQYALVQGVLIALIGTSATFGPLMADISHWFVKRRGLAVAICASGNYFAGTLWPPAIQYFVAAYGWRNTHIGIGIICLAAMLPLLLLLTKKLPAEAKAHAAGAATHLRKLNISPSVLQGLLIVAGVACCVAMSMPQVHIVAYCGDLGYGPARGAEMLSLMMGFGIISRLASGFVADRIGGMPTLLIGSVMQGVALLLYLPFDSLVSLYIVSAMFGLFQGGIVPSYAIVVRENFSADEAATRVGLVLTATLAGMALGGWMTGAIFDATGSYAAAFINGILWNVLNVGIVIMLMGCRPRRHHEPRPALALR